MKSCITVHKVNTELIYPSSFSIFFLNLIVWSFSDGLISFGQPPSKWFIPWLKYSARNVLISCKLEWKLSNCLRLNNNKLNWGFYKIVTILYAWIARKWGKLHFYTFKVITQNLNIVPVSIYLIYFSNKYADTTS